MAPRPNASHHRQAEAPMRAGRLARHSRKVWYESISLKDMYQMGHIERSEYLQKRGQLERQIAHLPAPSMLTFNIERAVTLLGDMSALLESASLAQRRAIIRQVLEMIWLQKFAVTAIKPAANFALLVELAATGYNDGQISAG